MKSTQKLLYDSQALCQLQVFRYPFSVATSTPKIPDGKLTQSNGVKIQTSNTKEGASQLYVLIPCLNTAFNGSDQLLN